MKSGLSAASVGAEGDAVSGLSAIGSVLAATMTSRAIAGVMLDQASTMLLSADRSVNVCFRMYLFIELNEWLSYLIT